VKEAEQAVAAFFHLNRSLGKRRPADDGDPAIHQRMKDRIRADTLAARHFWERQWG
jgi:hypothetical protein